MGGRSALGDERRHVSRRAVELPAHAELHVMRGDVLDRERTAVHDRDAIEGIRRAGFEIAQVHVPIGEFDGDVPRDLIAKASMQGPGEIPLCGVGGVGR